MTNPTDNRSSNVAQDVLLPCPFCGAQFASDGYPYPVDRTRARFIVGCDGCGFVSDADTPADAMKKWNRRTPDPRYSELIAASEEITIVRIDRVITEVRGFERLRAALAACKGETRT